MCSEILGACIPKGDVFINPPPRLGDLSIRKGKRVTRAKGGGFLLEMVSFKHNRTDMHMNSQGLWPHIQDLHRFKPDGTSV